MNFTQDPLQSFQAIHLKGVELHVPYTFLISFCRVLSRQHGSMSDLRKLVAETHAQRPKTDTAGMVDGLNLHTGEIDGEEERGKSEVSRQFVKCS